MELEGQRKEAVRVENIASPTVFPPRLRSRASHSGGRHPRPRHRQGVVG